MSDYFHVEFGSEELFFETGRIAKQAQGSVLVRHGETIVLSVACLSPNTSPGQDFFPLTVDYREKSASAGRIPGNFFRREGRPSEREILVARLTDRPLRPLFPKSFLNEVQVCSTVYSADNEHNPDVMSINGASAALHLSEIPFKGPIGAVRVCRLDGELVINPPMDQVANSEFDLVIAGTREAITMVEGSGLEIPEDIMVEALEAGHRAIAKICDVIDEMRAQFGKEKMPVPERMPNEEVAADVNGLRDRMTEAFAIYEKQPRESALAAAKDELRQQLAQKYGEELYTERLGDINEQLEELEKRLMREQVIKYNRRLDGRGPKDIRPITIEIGILPRSHGSALFTRGETQALVSTTLGTSRDEQRLDELTGEEFKRFMLHYNFPPWSVGEVRPLRGPGRREIGHGKLAERAIESLLPVDEDIEENENGFPYTIRVVSDITESNGSSSMASVCGATLSLLDAGVPLASPVAGIAMGLIKEGDEVRVLTDIMGAEDHLGDMDFKVCGTHKGITAFQMDVKVSGISSQIMRQALEQAREARLFVLDKMAGVISAPRPNLSRYAPRIYTIHIDVDKIRDVIGPGGKVVREIQKKSGAEIEIQDDGTINVASVDQESADMAIDMIRQITAEPEVGEVYKGTVSRIMQFGAFVSIMGGKEGLVHISELAPFRVKEVTDVVNIGDEISVKVIEVDSLGRLNLSKVQADKQLGLIDENEYAKFEARKERGGRSEGRNDRGGDRRGASGKDHSRGNRSRRRDQR